MKPLENKPTSRHPETRRNSAIIVAAPRIFCRSERRTAHISLPMEDREKLVTKARESQTCHNGLRRFKVRHRIGSATLWSALDSSGPSILQTAVTSPTPGPREE